MKRNKRNCSNNLTTIYSVVISIIVAVIIAIVVTRSKPEPVQVSEPFYNDYTTVMSPIPTDDAEVEEEIQPEPTIDVIPSEVDNPKEEETEEVEEVGWSYDDDLNSIDNIYYFLIEEAGLNTAAACGVIANIDAETGGTFDPTADGGPSYGLCQWLSTRLEKMYYWCEENGEDCNSIEGQLRFMIWELQYDDPYGTWDHLASVEDSAEGARSAGKYFCRWFERPADIDGQSRYRGSLAAEYFGFYGY